MRKRENKLLIWVFIFISVILVGLVLYLFVIRPSMTGDVIGSQKRDKRDDMVFNDGIKYAVYSIMQQATSCQPIPLTSLANQTVYIIAIGCPGTEEIVKTIQQTQPPV